MKLVVSRSGLTHCPGCQTFIKVASPVSATVCPFCQTAFSESQQEPGSGSSRSRGKKALLAAALLGASIGLAACPPPAQPYGIAPQPDASTNQEKPPQEAPATRDGGTGD